MSAICKQAKSRQRHRFDQQQPWTPCQLGIPLIGSLLEGTLGVAPIAFDAVRAARQWRGLQRQKALPTELKLRGMPKVQLERQTDRSASSGCRLSQL